LKENQVILWFEFVCSICDIHYDAQVKIAKLKPTSITITGPAAVNLDLATTNSQTQTHEYTAVVVDQLGQPVAVAGSAAAASNTNAAAMMRAVGSGRISWTLSSAEQIDPVRKRLGLMKVFLVFVPSLSNQSISFRLKTLTSRF
jgi:hypothetical protein